MNEDDKTEVREEPRPMSEEDVHDYNGLTLNQDGEEERPHEDETIHVEVFDIHKIPFWKKALIVLAIIAVLVLGVAVAWVFVLAGGVVFVALLIMYLLKRFVL